MTKMKWIDFTPAMRDESGNNQVRARAYKGLVLHRNDRGDYVLSHQMSGKAVRSGWVGTFSQVRAAVIRLADAFDFARPEAQVVEDGNRRGMSAVLRALSLNPEAPIEWKEDER